jgi:asparagine synthase (glutamine-hydrolysing)
MCGIIAYFSSTKTLSEKKLIQSMRTIFHRGPDSMGYWTSSNKHVALGHVRLSIIDLDEGNQPLHSVCNRIHAVVNGEFYQFEQIREELAQKGYRFRTHSDSEILVALYQEYGTECVKHLRGEFSFVLWDEGRQRLFACRDRFGIKPLYYSIYQGNIYFASEAKALFALGIPCQWNLDMVHSHESFLPSQKDTIFENVHSIKPGHFMLASKDSIQSHCYWDFNYPTEESGLFDASDDELIGQFRQRLEEAVKIRLRADVPVGCYLSGGLDSCSVLGLMNQLSSKPIDTFTVSFNDSMYDEAEIAKEMSDLVGSNHHCFKIDEQMMCDNFSDAIYHNETLIFNNNTVAKFLLSRFTQNAGLKVILTGEGSDEVLAGYPIFREDMLRYDNKGQDPVIIEELIKQLHERNKASHGLFSTSNDDNDLSQAKDLLGFIPTMLKATSAGGAILSALHNDEYDNQIRANNPLTHFLNSLNMKQLQGRSPLIKSLYLWSKSILPGFILVQLGDRMEMAHSLEGRVPFLDHHLVEFLTRVPNHLKINGLNEKYILRESVKDVITNTVYKRQKHPFLAPPASVKTNPFNQLILDTFHGDVLKHNPFYSQKKVLKLLDKAKSLPAMQAQELDKIFMHILSMCTVENRFKPNFIAEKTSVV